MSTIALNADDLLNEGTQNKKKFELNDKAKAAMAAGVAGVAVGAGVKAAVDAINNQPDEEPISEPEKQDLHVTPTSQTSPSTEPVESMATVEVNPDDVMLEEPVLESTLEDPVSEETALNEEVPEYQPFANNDNIEEPVYDGPLPEEPLYAQETDLDIEIGDTTVDLICGEISSIEETGDLHHDSEEQYAWEPETIDDTDIQSDLMA